MPLYHGTGGVTAVTLLMGGYALCIGKKFSTSRFWSDIRDSKATWFVYVGETARYLLAAPPSPLDKAHNVRGMYGNGLRPDVWHKFRDRFGVPEVLEFFNSTEGMFGLSNYCKGDYLVGAVGHHGLLMCYFSRNLYVPVRVDQVTGEIDRNPKTGFAYREPYEKGGEIFVAVRKNASGLEAFRGYHNDDKATSKKYAYDVFKKGDKWYRTGDALRRTKDGRWYFMDRLGDTFRWKGENVSTAEVSEVVGKFPGIVEANVYGVLLPNHDGRAGCAAIYIDPNKRDQFDFSALLK
jgi:acyl-CoA synthetase (AMP-forming)/AMP-acid ligase II